MSTREEATMEASEGTEAEISQYSFLDSIERGLEEGKSDEENDNVEIEEYTTSDEEHNNNSDSTASRSRSGSGSRKTRSQPTSPKVSSAPEPGEFRGVTWNTSKNMTIDMVPTTVNDEIQYLAVATVTTRMRQFWVNLLEENDSSTSPSTLVKSSSGSSSRGLLRSSGSSGSAESKKESKPKGSSSPRTSSMSTLKRLLSSQISDKDKDKETSPPKVLTNSNPLFGTSPPSPSSPSISSKDRRLSQSIESITRLDEKGDAKESVIETRPRATSLFVAPKEEEIAPKDEEKERDSAEFKQTPVISLELEKENPFELEERRKILEALEQQSSEEKEIIPSRPQTSDLKDSHSSEEENTVKETKISEPTSPTIQVNGENTEPFTISSPPKADIDVLGELAELEALTLKHKQLLAKLSEEPAPIESQQKESKTPPPIPARLSNVPSQNKSAPETSHFMLGNHRGASSTQSTPILGATIPNSGTLSPTTTVVQDVGPRGSLPIDSSPPSGVKRAASFLKRASLRHNHVSEDKPKMKRTTSTFLKGKSERKLYTFQEHKLHRIGWDLIKTVIPSEAKPEENVVGAPLDGYSLELGCELGCRKVRTGSRTYDLEDTEKYEHHFRDKFFKKDCVNYIGWGNKNKDVMLISISKPEEQLDESTKLLALIRTPAGDARVDIIRQEGKKKEDAKSLKKSIVKELKGAFDILSKTKLTLIDKPSLSDDLLDFENKQVISGMKFGILYRKQGQMTEEEMFGNGMDDVSPKFLRFLTWLGDKVTLKGFTGFRGGLDVKTDTTGTHSIYTKFADIELMFHVAPMLPHFKADVQQVEKKRHLGNDIVVIIFNDSTEPYSPHTIKTEFNHVYCIIQPQSQDPKDLMFKVGFASRSGVPPFGPLLPIPSIFGLSHDFRELLITKLMNGERAAFSAPQFAEKMSRTRKIMLENIATKYPK
eukprot:TRINITY_DN5265_c0_g1_i1.p1 TRINITY_DN5265_c0_g1~~TRINITY_DN5265_c0_g1_i1.p1  ORF type:complete len:941 (-),score=379.38 TRINITY_DN5265_c0_g1_i1:45-2867(-)